MSTTTALYWKCGCGKVQLKVSGEPLLSANCHCHSCVAAARFLDEKHKDKTNHTTSIGAEGGSDGSAFLPDQVTIISLPQENVGCLKVGPKGKTVRKYVKCCGTQFGVVEKAFWSLNRQALYHDEQCTQKFVPEDPVPNILTKFAFEPEQVPEPKSSMAPAWIMFQFIKVLLNPFGPSTDKDILEKFQADPDNADEVPITWE